MGQPVAIRARGISKYFGDFAALTDVDLDVTAGQVHGLLGPNGAGKTTLLALLLGLAVPDRGSLEILGALVTRALTLPDGVAGFVDGPGLYPSLTARANLTALGRLRGTGAAGVDEALREVGLSEVASDKVRGFSLGMRQRLGLAAALLTRPRLLVLDEPSNGLDRAGSRHIQGVLGRLAAEGTAVLLSSHRMDDLAALCDEVTILAAGRLVFSGPIDKLAAETDELDYRLVTSDTAAALRIAGEVAGVRALPSDEERAGDLRLRAAVPALDALVERLIHSGVAVRELAPMVPPLETAFLALTGGRTDASAPRGGDVPA